MTTDDEIPEIALFIAAMEGDEETAAAIYRTLDGAGRAGIWRAWTIMCRIDDLHVTRDA